MAFCNPVKCVRPSDSCIINCKKRSTTSIKSFLRRQLLKKSSSHVPSPTISHTAIPKHLQTNGRFQRIQGSNYVREINPSPEYSFKTDTTNNYDITAILDETPVDTSYRRKKKIPRWARKSQLQLAYINQIYFNDQQPEDIFGTVRIDLAYEMVRSVLEEDRDHSFTTIPPNFV